MRNFLALFILIVALAALAAPAPATTAPAATASAAPAAAATMVYWSDEDTGQIWRGAADGSGTPVSCDFATQLQPTGLAIHPGLGKMYWMERGNNKMRRANLDCSELETIGPTLSNPSRITFDFQANKIYWTENLGTNRIRRADLDGSNVETVPVAVTEPVGIAILDADTDYLYWTEFSTNQIWRWPMAGGAKQLVKQLGANAKPLDIVLNPAANALYWASGAQNVIFTADLTGNNVTNWRTLENPRSLAIDLDGGKLYWTAQDTQLIQRDNFSKNALQTLFNAADGVQAPLGIALYSGPINLCHSLIVNVNPTGSGSVTVSPAPNCGADYMVDTQVTLTANANSGYTFNNWSGDISGSTNPRVVTMNGDKTVTANFTQVVTCYTLTRTHTGSGNNPTASPSSSSGCGTGQYKAGEVITLTADPAAGWRVAGWSGTNNDASTSLTNSVTMPAAGHTVSVIYEAICYTLSRTHTGNGNNPVASPAFSTGCGTGQYTAGQVINLTATPAANHYVAGWSGTNDDASTLLTNSVTMPAAAHTVSVFYEPIPTTCFSLSRTHSGSGNNPVADPPFSSGCGTGQYKAGQVINLTATPAANHYVVGWSGTNDDASTLLTNSVTMPAAAHTVSVFYEPIPTTCFSLSRTHSGSGNNPVADPPFSSGCGTGQYKAGEVITLTADPADGWRVSGWSGTNNNSSTSTTNTATMSAGAHTVSVSYTEIDNPAGFAFFVPAVIYIAPSGPYCFAGPNEEEDNDSDDTANGPLCAAGTFSGLADDERDFFMFDTVTAGRVAVTITNHVPGMQLSLYYQTISNPPVDFDTEPGDGLDVELPTGQPGRYYIRVFTRQPNQAEARPYIMQVEFP